MQVIRVDENIEGQGLADHDEGTKKSLFKQGCCLCKTSPEWKTEWAEGLCSDG